MSKRINSLFLRDIELTEDETLTKATNVWAFDFKYLWITFIAIFIWYFIPIQILYKSPILLIILWYGTYSFRQSWRLMLTNRRIIARRLYPRPLSYFFTRIHNFPYKHLEGMSTGPRNNVTLFLVGLFLATNLGITILKSSLFTETLELPDTIEFVIFLMVLLPPFRNQGQQIMNDLVIWYQQFAKDILVFTGTLILVLGVILMLISFPWKQYLVLRVRYAKDFKLNTSVSNDFIKELYKVYYQMETTTVPKKFKKWHYPWFEGEKVEGIADMEQIHYFNRIIGTFALITGAISLWTGLIDLNNFNSTEFVLWLLVAFADIIIISLSIRFSTRESEFVITNYRIIFAQEIKQISGITGKRYFFISDLRRDDIASFDFRKVTSFAIEYLLAAVGVIYISIILLINGIEILAILFILFSILLFAFINQTYVGFSMQTKSGDKWVMRHQLANPATRLRQFIGSEEGIFSRMLANRLEEKEIINAVQVLRSHQLGLQTQKFEEIIQKNIDKIGDETSLNNEFVGKRFVTKRFSAKRRENRKRIQLSLEDILLKDEQVVWEKVIPFPLNWRFLTMFVGTVVFIIALPSMFIVALNFNVDPVNSTITYTEINPAWTTICIISSIALYALFQLKYFSLRRKSMVITKNRVFYEELVRPPKWLFFIGIFKESYIRESMINQLQKIGSGAYILGGYNWDKFIEYLKSTIIRTIIYFIIVNLTLLIESYWNYLPAAQQLTYLGQFTLYGLGIMITWSAANMMVHLIQSWPTLELEASGFGVNFRLPYLTQSEAETAQQILWRGVDTIDQVRESLRLRQQVVSESKKKKKKKEANR